MKKPVIKQLKMLENGDVYIAWSKCEGAQRYVVKKSEDENGEFKDVARIGNDVFDAVDKNPDPQKMYWYRVFACRKIGAETELKRSNLKMLYTLNQSKMQLINVDTDSLGVATLKWQKLDNVDGYAIFKRNEHATNSVCIKSVDKNTTESQEDTSVLGTINYYRIKAFIIVNETRVYIAESNECVSASVGKTKATICKKSLGGKVNITLSIISGASGYIIKEKATDGEFKEVLRSEANTQMEFEYKPKSKTSLEFIAVAYKNVGDEVLYSGVSEVFNVK